jgi:hypothetical protein
MQSRPPDESWRLSRDDGRFGSLTVKIESISMQLLKWRFPVWLNWICFCPQSTGVAGWLESQPVPPHWELDVLGTYMQRIRSRYSRRSDKGKYVRDGIGAVVVLALASQEPKCGMFGCMDGWSGRRSKPQLVIRVNTFVGSIYKINNLQKFHFALWRTVDIGWTSKVRNRDYLLKKKQSDYLLSNDIL